MIVELYSKAGQYTIFHTEDATADTRSLSFLHDIFQTYLGISRARAPNKRTIKVDQGGAVGEGCD